MIRHLLCWLTRGHEFENICDYCQRKARKFNCPTECTVTGVRCEPNKYGKVKICKHCGKVKK